MATVQATATNPSVALFDALNGAGNKSAEGKVDLQNRFLTLLTAQIRNQDPLNPLDNSQMTSQLAQISTVDGIERLNATLQALMSNSNESSAVQAAALVGHGVLVPGSGLRLDQGVALGGIELAEPADRVRVSIKDSNGRGSTYPGSRGAGGGQPRPALGWQGRQRCPDGRRRLYHRHRGDAGRCQGGGDRIGTGGGVEHRARSARASASMLARLVHSNWMTFARSSSRRRT
ncbi:MAG: hypothetical protein MZW92_52395 [Comamonadaceae bacterium]|nr:hypothetical protein [Comamonadaceae bacterium]